MSLKILVVALFPSVGSIEANAATTIQGQLAGCQRSTAQLERVNFHGHVLLNKNFLPKEGPAVRQQIDEAIELQLKHLIGLFKNAPKDRLNVALSSYRGPLRILKVEDAKYQTSAQIKDYLHDIKRLPKHGYTRKALARGFTDAGDAALRADYQIELILGDCSNEDFRSNPKLWLPQDPYLSLWIDRGASCASSEISSFGNHFISWFFWRPVTAEGQTPCAAEASQVFRPEFAPLAKIESAPEPRADFFKASRASGNQTPLKFTAIFGVLDSTDLYSAVDFRETETKARERLEKCQIKTDGKMDDGFVPACLSHWRESTAPENALSGPICSASPKFPEPGKTNTFLFLKYMSTLVQISAIESATGSGRAQKPDDMILKITGRFRESNQPVVIHVFYGKTSIDYGHQPSRRYLRFLYESLRDSDSIAYVGHAGLGQNLRYDVLEKGWKAQHWPSLSRTRPLWLGIYNCEAFSHFGFDLEPLFKKGAFDLFLAQTSGVDVGAQFPLTQLLLLENSIRPASIETTSPTTTAKALGHYAIGRDFLTVLRLHADML